MKLTFLSFIYLFVPISALLAQQFEDCGTTITAEDMLVINNALKNASIIVELPKILPSQ